MVSVSGLPLLGDASLAGLAASGQLPVQTVVNCSANLNLQSQHVEVLNIPALDEESYPLLTRHLPLFTKFLTARFREGKAVLVNCQAGVNRSVALVVGFLVEAFGLPLLDAVFYVRRRRGKPILLNEGFQQQLIQLARRSQLCPLSQTVKLRTAIQDGPLALSDLSTEFAESSYSCLLSTDHPDDSVEGTDGSYFDIYCGRLNGLCL